MPQKPSERIAEIAKQLLPTGRTYTVFDQSEAYIKGLLQFLDEEAEKNN